jgi:ATP-dependent RNA helicase DeaD
MKILLLKILAAVLSYCFEEDLSFEAYGDIKDIGAKDRQVDQQGKARLFISMGKKDKMTPRKLVDLVLTQVPIKAKHVSDILVMDSFSFVTVPFAKAERIVEGFKRGGGKPVVELANKAKKRDKDNPDRKDKKDKKHRKDKKEKRSKKRRKE